EYTYKEKDGYSQLWYRVSKDRIVVVVKQSRNFIEAITLFAYMFCIFILIAGLFRFLDMMIRARMRWDNLKALMKINIRKQVHGTIVFIVVFAFVILGAATITFFIYRYDKNHRDSLSKNMTSIAGDVKNDINTVEEFNNIQNFFDPVFMNDLQKAIRSIGEIHGVDINIYDLDGTLQASTQDLIYQKKLLSGKMDPQAFYQLNNLRAVQLIHPEKVGGLTFLSGYLPLRDEKGETFAYLNIPYFASQNDLNQEISNFLIALINLNAFIFLISGLLALLITNSITRSFTLISEKLKKINLTQQNDEIEWHRDDEIGMLVQEYNKMVRKLEVSAAMIAKSEREGAWREMARQVAHEIKNPLTPMKLSLQYLQKALNGNPANVKALSENLAKTLIEQIEHLSQIASDFSAFANISYANNEVFLLNEVLNSVNFLYQTDPGYEIVYLPPERLFYVFADKTQINRLFTNLLQNAIQAIPEEREGLIEVMAVKAGEKVLISVKDNGEGISDTVKSRIFMPNFTTKSSGTGLGLAMCKNIVEQARGRVWFDTKVGVGTVFYVELPLVES
ncbi:MAG TPA: HAMP domain-containing sensor histidine kinase, partial [Chitinophagaceae bacterium]